ncbi:hypothetical protein PCC8801_1333 [Rippkaea orientalis PCC 8801]|uniref:Uncharacterized protein n=1 Tax=Rippkaea orientalis (strain PCC 8801 / RF-1) TaxID=41431 RepID=B7K3Q4_RIPO1|nr:hypothetical protein PCC8801_1333 [Rippkaea orientalis PCC 8801]
MDIPQTPVDKVQQYMCDWLRFFCYYFSLRIDRDK